MIYLLDNQERIINALVNPSHDKGYIESKITEDIDSTLLKLEFKTLGNIDFSRMGKIVAQDQDKAYRLFAFAKVSDIHNADGFRQQVTANGEHVLLGKAKPIPPQSFRNVTLKQMGEVLVSGLNIELGQVDYMGVQDVTFDQYITPLAGFQQLHEQYGCILKFRIEFVKNKIVRILDLLKPITAFSGKQLIFTKDILEIQRDRDEQNSVSRMVGQAIDADGNVITFESINDGKNYVEDLDEYNRWNNNGEHFYSIHNYQPEDGGDIDKQKMLDATTQAMRDRVNANMAYSVTSSALEKIPGLEHEKVRVGMNVHIKDEFFNPALYLTAQVKHTEMPELDDLSTDFTCQFGDYKVIKSKLTQQFKTMQSKLFKKSNSWDNALPTAVNVGVELDNKTKGTLSVYSFGAIGDNVADDTEAIQNALNQAFTTRQSLAWGNGTFLVSANLEHLHDVTHTGHGIVRRTVNGTVYSFNVNPTDRQLNMLHADPKSTITNADGLTPQTPIGSLQTMFDSLINYGPVLNGSWVLHLTDGDFDQCVFPQGLRSKRPITIQGNFGGGDQPNTPTTRIIPTQNYQGDGLVFSSNLFINLINLMVSGFNAQNKAGILIENGCIVETLNVHTSDNYFGLLCRQGSSISVPNGVHDGNVFGMLIDKNSRYRLGDPTAKNRNAGPVISASTYGFFAQDNSNGALNWMTIRDCNDGLVLYGLSVAIGDGLQFINNKQDVRQEDGGNFRSSDTVIFSDGSDMSIVDASGFITADYIIDGVQYAYSLTDRIIAIKYLNQSFNSVDPVTFARLFLKAPHWRVTQSDTNLGKGLRFKITGNFTGTAGTKRVSVRFRDSTNLTESVALFVPSTTIGVFKLEGTAYFIQSNAIFVELTAIVNNDSRQARVERMVGFDLTQDTTFSFETQLESSNDSITIYTYEISKFG